MTSCDVPYLKGLDHLLALPAGQRTFVSAYTPPLKIMMNFAVFSAVCQEILK
jgi:hypothetical protein